MNAAPHLSQPQISHSSVPQNAYHSPQVSTQPMTEFPQLDSGLAVLVFTQGDDPIVCLNKTMAFLSALAASRFPSTINQLRTSSNSRNQATIQDGRVTVQQVQGRQGQMRTHGYAMYPTLRGQEHCIVFKDKKFAEENKSWLNSVISEVPHSESYHNDLDNQSMHAMEDFEQTPVVDFPDNEITSDSNIIPYSQYLQETQ
ncbi:hypothetical protein Tco_0814519 [Tanacetum coccineum]